MLTMHIKQVILRITKRAVDYSITDGSSDNCQHTQEQNNQTGK